MATLGKKPSDTIGAFAERAIGKHGNARDFAAGAGGGRQCDDRQMLLRHRLAGAMVVGDGIVGQTDARRGLGNVHRAAAAHGDDEFAMVLSDDLSAGVHFGDVRIREKSVNTVETAPSLASISRCVSPESTKNCGVTMMPSCSPIVSAMSLISIALPLPKRIVTGCA